MSFKLSLPTFDGRDGPIQAHQYLAAFEACMSANKIPDTDARRIDFALTSFVHNSPAYYWAATDKFENPDNWKSYEAFKLALQTEFCKPLTLTQSLQERKQLVLRDKETPRQFYSRCLFYHRNKDFPLADTVKAEPGYTSQFKDRVKESFLAGLPASLLSRLVTLDLATASCQDILQAASNAALLLTQFQPSAASATASGPTAVDEVDAVGPPPRARRPQRTQPPSSGRRPPPPAPRPGAPATAAQVWARPSLAELRSRTLATCGRCRRLVKHRAAECFVDLNKPPGRARPMRAKVNELDNSTDHTPDTVDSLTDLFDPLN